MLEKVIAGIEKLPPGVVDGLAELVETLLLGKSEEAQRKAIDLALAAAEEAIVRERFPG